MNQSLEPPPPPAAGGPTQPRQRLRLPAELRMHQILDAALHAFGADGFAATRMEDIARLAGLSKGGVYAHFRSKDDIFEALLTRSLAPRSFCSEELAPDVPVTVALLVERIIDQMYADLSDRHTLLALRLLLTEGNKAPQRVDHWRHAVMEPYFKEVEALVERGVAEGTLRHAVVADAPWLLVAPGLFSAMFQMAFSEVTPAVLEAHRRAHVEMVYELLSPQTLSRGGDVRRQP